jgi:NADPH-dependent curcumin reductase CurA
MLFCFKGANGTTRTDHFEYKPCDYPSGDLQSGEVLVQAEYLSIDPALVSFFIDVLKPMLTFIDYSDAL